MPRKVNPISYAPRAIVASLVSVFCSANALAGACVRSHEVIAEFPHDTRHFTQGLLIIGDTLYESVGGYGSSAIHAKELRSGRSRALQPLPASAFGEGLARVGDQLLQVTWREQIAFRFDLRLVPIQAQHYVGEGWGLASWRDDRGDEHLVLSDGTATLRFLDPATLAEKRHLPVRDGTRTIDQLNELEFVRGEILANVWHSDRVAAIDPRNGEVRGWFDFSDLKDRLKKPEGWNEAEHVLNGLAFDRVTGHLFVTGKQWPTLFEVAPGECRDAMKVK
ncbi:MAG: glutaminyl-peptide cyclotransferase [Panacagrimonas sp.]